MTRTTASAAGVSLQRRACLRRTALFRHPPSIPAILVPSGAEVGGSRRCEFPGTSNRGSGNLMTWLPPHVHLLHKEDVVHLLRVDVAVAIVAVGVPRCGAAAIKLM